MGGGWGVILPATAIVAPVPNSNYRFLASSYARVPAEEAAAVGAGGGDSFFPKLWGNW